MSDLPPWRRAPSSEEPYSRQSAAKASRLRGATVTEGLCPYCAVGCGQLIYTKAGKLIDIEGNPESPINEGTLCPKGSNTFQLTINPHRQKSVLYRAPYSDRWETRSLDWAMGRIAQLTKETRDATFVERDEEGVLTAIEDARPLGAAAVAVCLIWSIVNPDQELRGGA